MAYRKKPSPRPPSDPSPPDWDALPEAPNAVTIFGAGIAGLTAAHELVERGFQVQVWEKRRNDRHPDRGCDVGGLARTQWAATTWPEVRPLDAFPDGESDWTKRRTRPITFIAERFYLRFETGDFTTDAPGKAHESWTSFEGLLAQLVNAMPKDADVCRIEVAARGGVELKPSERKRRVEICREHIEQTLGVVFGELSADDQALELHAEATFATRRLHVEVLVTTHDNPDFARIRVAWLKNPERGSDRSARVLLDEVTLRRRWLPSRIDSVTPENTKEDLSRALDKVRALAGGTVYFEVAAAEISRLSEEETRRRVAHATELFTRLLPSGVEVVPRPDRAFSYDIRWGKDVACHAQLVPIDRFPYQLYEDVPEDIEVVCSFRPREYWLPGEHGYRFFPSFYHHVFDTMKRTPLLDLADKAEYAQAQERAVGVKHPEPRVYVESGRVVMDNVHPTSSTLLAFSGGQRPSKLSRHAVRSFEELREYLAVLFDTRDEGGLGFTPRDATRLALKILKFATASDARRREYEALSWWDYLEADTLSEGARDTLERLPQALVAMNAKECDARTQWVPFIQILLDEVRPDTYRDGTLRGPTSEAWLNPWRRYLEAQGVEFVHGELEGFELVEAEGNNGTPVKRVWPRVQCFDQRYPGREEIIGSGKDEKRVRRPFLRPGYFVLAVSADQTRQLAKQYVSLGVAAPEGQSDLRTAQSIGGDGEIHLVADLARAEPESAFRHFVGIQFYFAEDVFWMDGHVYFPDSPWRITSISQARFWQDRMDWEHGYRGVLSAIIGNWQTEGQSVKKAAWDCTEAELAEEVWAQITAGMSKKREGTRADAAGRFARRTPEQEALPDPIHWHLDTGLRREPAGAKHFTNETPFLVNPAGAFEKRPGNLDPSQGYRVENGFVLAGYYTQTFTRIPSMEAANESARHAVNAILRHLSRKGAKGTRVRRTYCDIWSPEDRELDDLRFLKELDEKLVQRGLPHLLDIFDVDHLGQHLLRGGSRDPLDPLRLLSRLRRLYRDTVE